MAMAVNDVYVQTEDMKFRKGDDVKIYIGDAVICGEIFEIDLEYDIIHLEVGFIYDTCHIQISIDSIEDMSKWIKETKERVTCLK